MKTLFPIVATLLVLAVSGCAPQVDVAAEQAAIEQAQRDWLDATNKPGEEGADGYASLRVRCSRSSPPSSTFWRALPDVSNPSEEQPAMSSVIFVHTRYGTAEKFNHLIGEFHKAIEKTNMPWNYEWYALVSGGNVGTYALVLPRPNFAAFNPTGKPFPEMLEEAYGKAGADALLAKWRKVVKSENTELSRNRPDLSYIPGQ